MIDSPKIEYKLQFSKRKSVGIIINESCDVLIRAPYGMHKDEVEKIIKKKEDWILSKLEKFKDRDQLEGNEVMFLGKVFKKEIIEQKFLKRDFVCIDNDKFLINVKSKESADKVLEKYFRSRCEEEVKYIVNKYSLITGLRPKEIKVKEQKTKWGCCTYDNRIFFNWRLIMARKTAVEYVVVHEMCHMIHKNHSKEFWNEVKKIMPEYEVEDRYLKEKGYLMKI